MSTGGLTGAGGGWVPTTTPQDSGPSDRLRQMIADDPSLIIMYNNNGQQRSSGSVKQTGDPDKKKDDAGSAGDADALGDKQAQSARDFAAVNPPPKFLGNKPVDDGDVQATNGSGKVRSDADMRARVDAYQQDFDRTLDDKIGSIDKEVADIDDRLDRDMFGKSGDLVRAELQKRKERLLQERADLQKIADSPDADRQAKFEAYQRQFDQAVNDKIADADQKIADIDRQLDQLQPGGRGDAMRRQGLLNSKRQLLQERADLQKIADTPDAALQALKAQQARQDGSWTASDIGHLALDVIGLAPLVGEWADGLNAAWYFSEGRNVEGAASLAGMAPVAGIFATIGKWIGKGADDAAAVVKGSDDAGGAAKGPDAPGGKPETQDAGNVEKSGDAKGATTKVGDFSNIEGASPAEVMDRIPAEADVRELHPIPGKVTEGYEYSWVGSDGQKIRVRVHGPDASAPDGSNAQQGWIIRVQKGRKYMDNNGDFHRPGIQNPQSPHYDPKLINDTHIPVKTPKSVSDFSR